MRKDIVIIINPETNQVLRNSDELGITSENLQGKIVLKLEPFVEGVCRMYIKDKGSILMQKNGTEYTLDIKDSLLADGDLDACFKVTESEDDRGVPKFVTKIIPFSVLETIETDEEIPEQYPTWIETFDSKIAEVQNLEETVSKNEDKRNESENIRIQNEENRLLSENERVLNEENRRNSEDERISNENERIQEEIQRTTNESNRKEKELKRQSDESTRQENEEIRIENENKRILAEENRENTTKEAVDNIIDMTESYNENAEQKKQEINAIADGVKDMATAIQFANFEVDDDMNLLINTPEKLKNTNFLYDEETGELEVMIDG